MIIKYCSKCFKRVWVSKDILDRLFGFGDKFCNECGESTKTSYKFICSKGHLMTDYDTFCEKCGNNKKMKVY